MLQYSGELAALAAALLWSFTTLFFTASAERIGALAMNQIRITLAVVLISIAHFALYGFVRADLIQTAYLAVSGLVGLVLGDSFYFRAMVLLGPKRTAVLMTLWPGMAALLAWLILSESVTWPMLVGMSVTLSGVAWTVGARPSNDSESKLPVFGIVCGLMGAFGQALGMVFAKQGLRGMDHELSGSLIRMAAACLAVWLIAGLRMRSIADALRNRPALGFAAAGALTGPFLGVWMSLYAAAHSSLGVASTLMATTPIFIIPQAMFFRGERPTWREILGAVVAVAGVALLFNAR